MILHIDMDAFFASVEQRDHPEYRGKPLIVGAPRDRRGVVSTCSYEARKFGVHSAMPSREAARLCPQGIFIQGDHRKYSDVSRQVMKILERYTPLVEPVSIDEAFLDVTGVRKLFGDGESIAKSIRRDIREELGLAASAGVAQCRFVAKLCSELAKPDGLCVAPSGTAELIEFLAPLSVGSLFGVGKVLREKLEKCGLHTVRDIQKTPETALRAIVGENLAEYLRRLAYGIDPAEICVDRDELSLSREHTFDQDCSDRELVRLKLRDIADDVGRRLRASGKWATVVKLKLRWANFTTISRQRHLAQPIRDDFSIFEEAQSLFDNEKLVAPIRLIGFGVSGLTEGTVQQELNLFGSADGHNGSDRDRKEKLSSALDNIRAKLGDCSIRRG